MNTINQTPVIETHDDEVDVTPVIETHDDEVDVTPEILEETRTSEEIKASAEHIEEQIKEFKKNTTPDIKETYLVQNYLIREQKAQDKLENLHKKAYTPTTECSQKDIFVLAKNDIDIDSKEADVLERYMKAGIISDYKAGLNHVGVQAEFQAIKQEKEANNVIDEHDNDDFNLNTKTDMIAQFEATGDLPEDTSLLNDLAKANIEKMNI